MRGEITRRRHRVRESGVGAIRQLLQLRKRGIDRVVLAGMSANVCVESHLRELLEQGFDVAVVTA